jgi:hypothetical protein
MINITFLEEAGDGNKININFRWGVYNIIKYDFLTKYIILFLISQNILNIIYS